MPTIRLAEDTYDAIHQLGGTFDSADDIVRQLLEDAGHADLLENPDEEGLDGNDFEESIREQFDLGDSVTAGDAIAVARLLREGSDRSEAFQQRADERDVNPSTVRQNCKRSFGVDTAEEFEEKVLAWIEQA